MTIIDLHNKYKSAEINYYEAEQLLYNFGRDQRFELFIALYEATLKNNSNVAYKVFREAYCSSDNIHKQINNSQFAFELKDFLNSLKKQGFNFYNQMRKSEKEYYDNLPDNFCIYRGMSELEKLSSNFGISWSLSKNEAEKYIYFDKNNVQKGGLASKKINREEVLTIFCVHGIEEVIHLSK
ncbi:hypothetical protein [Thalassobellus citreus]|uniref:hypothetical protein n=1 Tax=Thalassobellus citreus TaxID=3367752 RepID=UPI0037A567EF